MLGALVMLSCAATVHKPVSPPAVAELPLPDPAPRDPCLRQQPELDYARMTYHYSYGCFDCQVPILRKLIASAKTDDQNLPELIFRLAELHAETALFHHIRFFENTERVITLRAQGELTVAAKLQAEQKAHAQREKYYWQEALKGYTAVLSNPTYQKHERIEKVLGYAIFCALQLGKLELAQLTFARLVREHPQSAFLPIVLLWFGEYHFEQRQFAQAIPFYDQVLRLPQNSFETYALYKKAWALYGQDDLPRARALFIDVLAEAQKTKSKMNRNIVSSVQRELVQTYARTGTADDAVDFFRHATPALAPTLLNQLASLYLCRNQLADLRRLELQLGAGGGPPSPARPVELSP